jgi:3-deoxy-manno-octulosonate cytidylyltransferase (CMP-KDO synthetase)
MKNYLLIIPARYKSKRLPAKPLIDIKGLPMIIRTFNQCNKVVPRSKILVATDNKKIQKICANHNINSMLTSTKCLTGTDRIAEVAKKIKRDFYINVQGDEPIANPSDIKKVINYAKRFPNKIINGYTKITNKELFFSSHIPKVVFDKNGSLIYMSRAPIPFNKDKKLHKAWRQICIYSFPFKSLKIFSSLKNKTPIEKIEDIELIRFLELGIDIKMIKLSNKSIAVDTYKDLTKVRKIIKS